MESGPTYIYKCPDCGRLITKESLSSGNTFGAKIFSDGKMDASMLPEYPEITKCKKCGLIFWLNEANEIGDYLYGYIPDDNWKDADEAEFLSVYDYFKALKLNLAKNKEDELYIRQRILRGFNDRVRKRKKRFTDENDESLWKANNDRLLELLDSEDDNQKILIAEINRYRGDFERCMKVIESIKENELDWIKEVFKRECEKKNRKMLRLE